MMHKHTAIIDINNVSVEINWEELLHSINLSIAPKTAFGFLGPNGAGKTTTMKTILGLLTPSHGSISVLGGTTKDKSVRARIGFMPENTYLYKHLSAYEFLKFNGDFFRIEKNELNLRISELLEKVGLSHARNKRLSTFSKGMLQRVWLAQALINKPELVFLDEPMSGLDPIWRKMVKDLILELKHSGVTVFFNTHILSDVESICDEFAIIHQWSLIAHDRVSNISIPLEEYFMQQIPLTEWMIVK
jgi:ABC-2 type transport system ATP-binding protein